MLSRNLGLALILAAASAPAAQQRFFFTRKYTVGHVDSYVITMDVTSPMAMKMSMKMSQTVTKVYPNGDADVKAKTSNMSMTMNGKPIPDPTGGAGTGKSMTMRLNKFGNPVGAQKSSGAMMGMDMGLGSGINGLEKGLIMGKSVPFQVVSKDGTGPTIKGTIRLASIKNGIARLDQEFDMSTGQSAMTMHGSGGFNLRIKDGAMLSTDMTMKGTTIAGASTMRMSIKHS